MRRLMQTIIALPSITSRRALPMLHEILGDEAEAFLRADDRLQRRPLRLELFLVVKFFAFGGLLEVRVNLRASSGFNSSFASRPS